MSAHRPHPTYAIANIDGLPDRPAVFELLGVNQNDNSYVATCVSVAGVVCAPGHLAAADIIARFASRETAFTVLAERVSNLKAGAVAAASHPAFVEATTAALADQHEIPGILSGSGPAPVSNSRAALIADLGEGLHTSARRAGANNLWQAISRTAPDQWNEILDAVVEYTILPLIKRAESPGAPLIRPAPVEATAQMLADVPIMRFFHYAHLPDALREVSKPFAELALSLVSKLPPNAERSVALRKLLEAKDAAVRASLPTGYGEKI